MISIVTVNWRSYDWLNLLVESLELYATEKYELIVVSNDFVPGKPAPKKNMRVYHMPTNLGHGEGLNVGSRLAQHDVVMFLDVDCHFLQRGWERAFLELLETHEVVAGRGVPQKPIRPACMCLQRDVAAYYDWRDTPGYKGHRVTPEGFDVACKAYHEMLRDGIKLGFFESTNNRYGTLNGEEWCVGETPYIYHHWHGSHLKERQVDFPENDLLKDKEKLFGSIPWRQV